MKIPFEIPEEEAFCNSTLKSIENLINLSNSSYNGGGHNHAVLARVVVDIKALTYVGMFGLVEGMVRRSCRAFGRTFIELPPEDDLPSAPFVACVYSSDVGEILGGDEAEFWSCKNWSSDEADPLFGLNIPKLVPSVSDFWSAALARGEEGFDPNFKGFFSTDSILAYSNFYGLSNCQYRGERLYDLVSKEYRTTLDRIREVRNQVAHGQHFLKEVGRKYSTTDLGDDFKKLKAFQSAWMNAVRTRGADLSMYYRISQ